jgi:hypothetical protein
MPTNYRDAIRQSFYRKLALYLSLGTRQMDSVLTYNSYGYVQFPVISMTDGSTLQYGITVLEQGQDPLYKGVNIEFFPEQDASVHRFPKNKRYLLPVKITTFREIDGNIDPVLISTEVRNVMQKVLETLSDGVVEIWDYTGSLPLNTKFSGDWFDTGGYEFGDDSAAFESGDIRNSISLNINYHDFSF